MFLVVMRLLIIILFVSFLWTQIFKPLKDGLPLFPIFRKENKLRNDLADVKQELTEQEIKEAISEALEKLEKKNSDQEKQSTTETKKEEEKKDAK